ncbi:branched-chain amino acid ABC transporter permease [Thermogemmatispora carboxidivorans]|uniref:branched-chain amino acid ABC transporter permease n=1 Tax=Thermogemmatispora carboxidivorans TaxID=1382306 RepID=UPI00069C2510|nr:branched-chain amino acid ABC transporter permease [Thermogemmatispora carboxidivorans]
MAMLVPSQILPQTGETRRLLVKWVVALLVPVLVFTLVWSGEAILNAALVTIFFGGNAPGDVSPTAAIAAGLFMLFFYGVITGLTGYLVAADSGRQGLLDLWISMFFFTVVPILLIYITANLFVGLAASVVIWAVYYYGRRLVQRFFPPAPLPPLPSLKVLDAEMRETLLTRARLGSFWFAFSFSLIWLLADLLFYFTGQYGQASLVLLIWILLRSVLLPAAGWLLGSLGGRVAIHHAVQANGNGSNGDRAGASASTRRLRLLSATRAREEARDLVPNDLPLRSTGARNFYLLLLLALLLFYPMIDPFLFGPGTDSRLDNYGNAGYYVILALGLNIVVGFAGLLDLGYVAFFVIGAYTWAMIGSPQLTVLTGIHISPDVWPWLFWPMLIVAALIAALWGVLLGAPTLRLRGDYLAIVTLGFGEIIPIVVQNLDKYTNGTNGLTGIYSPAFFGVRWNVSTSEPYYYLILALIAIVLLANLRLRDSRIGRAWIAMREDEIAASSSGINLTRTKLLAFAAGAFFSGIAGAYYAAKLSTVTSGNFSFSDSVIYLAMVVLGGLGSIPGVVVGALAVYAVNVLVLPQLDALGNDPGSIIHPLYTQILQVIPNFSFSNIRNLIFGIILVVLMIFRPEGLIPSTRRRRELHRTEAEGVEVTSLDTPPGTPGFESEMRVE